MVLAAWARAEHCALHVTDGRIEPYRRHEPSDALRAALDAGVPDVVGSLGFAIPIELDLWLTARWASWPATVGVLGARGRS